MREEVRGKTRYRVEAVLAKRVESSSRGEASFSNGCSGGIDRLSFKSSMMSEETDNRIA